MRGRTVVNALKNLRGRQLKDVPAENILITCAKDGWYKSGYKTAVFHTCRQMAATLLTNDAIVNTKLTGDLLGHASERTTNRYIHAKKSLIEAVNMV